MNKKNTAKIKQFTHIILKSLMGVPVALLIIFTYQWIDRDVNLSLTTLYQTVFSFIILLIIGGVIALGFLLIVGIPGYLFFERYKIRNMVAYVSLALLSLGLASYLLGWNLEFDIFAFYLITPTVCVAICFWWLAVFNRR